MRPYIDFYVKNRISPVHQDISDLQRHLDRRNALYRHLGIPPGAVRGGRVLEFGPGSGHNAIHTASLAPALYTLVDANPVALEGARANLTRQAPTGVQVEIVESLIEEHQSDGDYDLVLCEGVIPFQLDPVDFARKVARHVKPGGLVVITCIDGASFMGEATRRLIADHVIPFTAPTPERLQVLTPLFTPHLATLAGMSRPVEDWIYDNILIPYTGRLFSIPDAIDALGGDFDVFGASPHYLTDWRWYKQIGGVDPGFNALARDGYHANSLNFLDYRVALPPQPVEIGQAVMARATALFTLMVEMESKGSTRRMGEAVDLLNAMAAPLESHSPRTAASLREVSRFLAAPAGTSPGTAFDDFRSFFGRGQQYVSFSRRM